MSENRLNYDFDGDGINDTHMEEYDTNGDGEIDFKTFDTDGDGITDRIYQDTDFDGHMDFFRADKDGDGYFERESYDTDGDDKADLLYIDTDGDGTAEKVFLDSDFDGNYDTVKYDEDHDGFFEKEKYDTNGDGEFDLILEDTDGDGTLDTQTYGVDIDGDGIFDVEMKEYYEDLDGDGVFDKVTIMEHNDATNEFEVLEIRDLHTGDIIDDAPSKDELVEINPVFYDEDSNGVDTDNIPNFDPATADMSKVVGDPAKSMEIWEYQGHTNRCAQYAQKFIVEELTGRDIDIEDFVDISKENGWFSEEGGTKVKNLDKMLQYYGIDTEISTGNDLTDIAEALNNGDKIIVGVDADEYWYSENDGVYSPGDSLNHAVEVIGIDYSDPENPMIIINDSGSQGGCGDMIPYQTFMDAWEDSDFTMVVADAN